MVVLTEADPRPISDDEIPALLEILGRTGSIRSTGAIGRELALRKRRREDPEFRRLTADVLARGRLQQLRAACDELVWATEAVGQDELDALVNSVLPDDPASENPLLAARLGAARERLAVARLEWAKAILKFQDYKANEPDRDWAALYGQLVDDEEYAEDQS